MRTTGTSTLLSVAPGVVFILTLSSVVGSHSPVVCKQISPLFLCPSIMSTHCPGAEGSSPLGALCMGQECCVQLELCLK